MLITNDFSVGKHLIDFHLHSDNSDGEQSAEEVIKLAKEQGLSVIAITDHNTFTHTVPYWSEGMLVIPGAELSADYYVPGWGESTEVHIISIFPDGVNPENFKNLLAEVNIGKETYVKAILSDLETRGIHITMDEVKNVDRKTKSIGRHGIAKVLVAKEFEEDIDSAFDHQIGNFSPYYIPATRYIHYASMKDIVCQVIKSGGIPILAHPYGYSMDEIEIEQLIADFAVAANLGDLNIVGTNFTAGMEVYYERYLGNEQRMSFLKRMQKKYRLLASAGSDRHREGQPFCSGGQYELYEIMVLSLKNDVKDKSKNLESKNFNIAELL